MDSQHIPFLNTATDCAIAKKFYSDSVFVRLSLETLTKTISQLPTGPKRWIDPAIDGLHRPTISSPSYQEHITSFAGHDRIGDKAFQSKPDKNIVNGFVENVLDECVRRLATPDWLSVPQLPMVDDSSRNRINRLLAESAANWKLKKRFVGKLIVPAVFTNQRQVNKKTERNKKLSAILNSYQAGNADGVWVADSTLDDQDGSKTFEHTRFPAIVHFHTELNGILPDDAITIAGPYWGLNLVLWARGLVTYSAIGMGNSYQYHIPGAVVLGGKSRLALTPLRRWAIANPTLKQWIDSVLDVIQPTDPAYAEFSSIAKDFGRLQIQKEGREQIAQFYKRWTDKFSTLPHSGRALALYQDLSSAYVLGKKLPQLPAEEKTARSPARVAKQFMLNCL